MSCSVMVSGFVLMFVVYLMVFNVVCFLSLVRDGCFCLICDACRLRCSLSYMLKSVGERTPV